MPSKYATTKKVRYDEKMHYDFMDADGLGKEEIEVSNKISTTKDRMKLGYPS